MKRRLENYPTFKAIQAAGFQVIFLIGGDTHGGSVKLEAGDESFLNLIVPIEDIYEFLSLKLKAAYDFLYEAGVKSILKIDDDIKIYQADILDYVFHMPNDIDYFGVVIAAWQPGIHTIPFHKLTIPFFKTLKLNIEKEFKYFGGPFYWVSRRAMNALATHSFEYCLEDMSVGLIMHNTNMRIRYIPWYNQKFVHWGDETEV